MDKTKTALRHRIENTAVFVVMLLVTLLLLLDIFLRPLNTGVPGSTDFVQHLVLWIAFIGAMITTREKKHICLAITRDRLKGRLKSVVSIVVSIIITTVLSVMLISSLSFILEGFSLSDTLVDIPVLPLLLIMPAGFLVMLIRFIKQSEGGIRGRLLACLGILLGLLLSFNAFFTICISLVDQLKPDNDGMLIDRLFVLFDNYNAVLNPVVNVFFWPVLVLLVAAALFGAPVFIILGGIAIMLYTGNPLSMVSNLSGAAYEVFIRENIPAIPLFALVGFILSESKAGERLIDFFNAVLGWLPGGLAIVAVIACGFFTTFTGATGVTILALGGILGFALQNSHYSKKFSEGLLTSAGSIGLLFFPSLPLIMYGVAAQINIKNMFVGGFIPGIIMMLALIVMVIIYVIRHRVKREKYKLQVRGLELVKMILEILLPVSLIVSFLSGFTTLTETGALAVLYVLVVEVFLPGDIKPKELPAVFLKAAPVVGGLLIIMAIAMGLNSYIIDAEVPMRLAEWMKSSISSPLLFLVLLNIALLITGCFMDIFSAILVIAPLVIALGVEYGINEIHLGIIFLANLQLGYLTPPVGLNLFLASYRFEAPLSRIYRDVIPFFIALLITVILITYVPILSTGLVDIIQF